jgi:glycerol 3-phosphatase-2
VSSLIHGYDAFVVDLDGVVWRGGEAIPGSSRALQAVRSAGKRLVFLTNNSGEAPEEVARKLTAIGVDAAPSEVLTSASVAARWIRERGLEGSPALVVGPLSVERQFEGVVGLLSSADAEKAALVFVGRDTGFTFERLDAASRAVRGGALLLAANRDPTMPVPGGEEPGTGAILAAIEIAAGARAVVVGKPEGPMMKAAGELVGPGRVLMIGDRPESDVAGARRAGWDAALVLTGVTAKGHFDPEPDYVLRSLADVAEEAPERVTSIE